MKTYKKWIVSEEQEGSFSAELLSFEKSFDLPQDYVLIKVHYTSLNYKDALSFLGNKGVSKNYPHTPGIDASGTIEASNSSKFSPNDNVIITGKDLGMNTGGGFSEYIQVPESWVIKLPENLSLKQAMQLGTAGLTAAMCVYKLLKNGTKEGKILVSGASGGVGTISILLLKKLGFTVTALSRKPQALSFLKSLGADDVITGLETNDKPLLKPIYDGAIDTVGGNILSSILKQIKSNGTVAVCGMALSPQLNTTVFPFILRGINMVGIDSAEADNDWKNLLWQKLSEDWQLDKLDEITKKVSLENILPEVEKISKGEQLGRVLVEIS
jgi:acrylyl-CoA reductase (NADPH)